MRKTLLVFFSIFVLESPVAGQARLNLINLKQDTHVFEKIVDERVKLNFTNPFAMTANSQASYVQGYGVVVTFHLRIGRAKIRLPFDEIDAPDTLNNKEVEKEIRKVREILIDCLSTHADSIKQLGAHDKISISAHIEDRNELDPIMRIRVLVVTTTKDNADLLAMRQITPGEFRQRLHVLNY